ncbi:MAG TPA: hypothetical protein VGF34_20705 [Stellaceae bacterium]|jgi:hypothetical protein
MSLRQKYLNILASILPAGAAGLSLLLGSTIPASAELDSAAADLASVEASVAARLAAIRDAVSETTGANATAAKPQLAWWANGGWRNGGGGWRNGGVWRNGGWGWHNGGWGWHNGGWHNGWHNYWRNW